MKNKLLILCLIALASVSYAEGPKYEGPAHYRIFETQDLLDPIERGAYENLLRLVDEKNRQNGVESNYLEKSRYKNRMEFDHVDLVPVAQFAGSSNDYSAELPIKSSSSVEGYSSIRDIVEKGDSYLKETQVFDKLSSSREGNIKRFFFGKGNRVNDIIVAGKNGFDEKVKEMKASNKDKYLLEGVYVRPFSSEKNQIGMSIEEYKQLKGKSHEEQLKFLEEKINLKFSQKVYIKDGALYTKDNKGKEWKVLCSLEAVSIPQISYGTTKKYYKDDIFTNIFVYLPTKEGENKEDSRGKVLYSKDNDIIIEDKFSYSDVATIREELKKQYLKDKENLKEEEFNKKWVEPFQKGGEFEKDVNAMTKELEEASKEKIKWDNIKKEANSLQDKIQEDQRWPKDLYSFTLRYMDENKRKETLEKYPNAKDLLEKWFKQYDIYKEADEKSETLDKKINEEIPKQYGFYNGWGKKPGDDKWLTVAVKNKDIVKKYLGKNVEFRGQGRIDGTIDLGDGNNELIIAEQFTGKYGTNIILGPRAKLKNISAVNISGAIGGGGKVSLSGRTSLTLDIDPSVKNAQGHLIQHALKDSDKNIIFRSQDSVLHSNNRNDFAIELMTSRISESSIVDMGRKANYTVPDFHDPAKKIDMKMKIISDSIAHTVSEKKELSAEGNTLLAVEIRDKLKQLDEQENSVYASIRNSKKIDVLQPTLTTTNKKTTFNVTDDDREQKKKIDLIHLIKTKNPEEVIKEASQFYLDKLTTEKMMKKIEEISHSDKMEKLREKTAEWKEMTSSEEYKHLNLEEKKKKLSNLDPNETWQSMRQNIYNQETIDKKVAEMKEFVNSFDLESVKKVSEKYPNIKRISSISDRLKYLKEELEQNLTKEKIEGLFSALNTLKADLEKQILMSEETLENEMVEELEKYSSDLQKTYLELKDVLFYSIREEEALSELKNVIGQLQEKNIYSKLNKIAKNEISTYTNLPFDIDRSLIGDRAYTRGSFISSRNVQKNFKGNIYTGYGIYEEEYTKGLRLGAIAGGANTKHTETYSRTLRTVATESNIQGVSAYVGAYVNKAFTSQLEWISGLGLQYGYYTVKRQLKNNYQELKSKGNSQIGAVNTYTGLVYSYPLPNDLMLRGKGILSYSLVHQGRVKEKDGLKLDIAAKDYHYVDGELGISLAKTLYDDSKKSTLAGGISGIFGLSGYDNGPLKAKIHGSTSGFNILGDNTKKDAVKIYLDYNMQIDTGFNYGLEGTYITNNEQNDVKIGLKAGYKF